MSENQQIGNDRGLQRVMIARFRALGDVVTAIPIVYSLCLTYPDVEFIMLTRRTMQGIFIEAPKNLTLVPVDNHEIANVGAAWRLAQKVTREYRPDAFVDLHDNAVTRTMRTYMRLHKVATTQINNATRHQRALTRKTNKVLLPLTSRRAAYRQAFFSIGLPIEQKFHGVYGRHGKGDTKLFSEITGEKGCRWVGIAPFAAYPGKEYPPERMREVIDRLSERGDCRIFIFGGSGREKEIADRWASEIVGVTSLCGKQYGFAVELALLSHLDVMVTMDSANMHLASIVGTPTVTIWGATHPYCGFRGWHQGDDDMVQLPLSCRPCSIMGNKECFRHDRLCLSAIRPDMIYQKIATKLAK